MIRTKLGYDEVKAKRLLLLHGSVNAVLEAEKEEKSGEIRTSLIQKCPEWAFNSVPLYQSKTKRLWT